MVTPTYARVEKDSLQSTYYMSPPRRNQKNNLVDLETDVPQTPRKPGWPTAYCYLYCEDWSDPLMTNKKKKKK